MDQLPSQKRVKPGCNVWVIHSHKRFSQVNSAKPGKGVKPAREKAPLPRINDLPLCAHRSSLYNDFRTARTRWREKNAWDLTISRSRSRF